jgi:hypothetical protein
MHSKFASYINIVSAMHETNAGRFLILDKEARIVLRLKETTSISFVHGRHDVDIASKFAMH